MFNVRIDGKEYRWFNGFSVELHYSSVASKFSFNALFEPDNAEHRRLFKPFSYKDVEVYYDNNLLVTGTILNISFSSQANKTLAKVEGYSKTGVLQDCNVSLSNYPLEMSNMSPREMFEKLAKPYNIDVLVNDNASEEMDDPIDGDRSIGVSESISQFMSKICIERGLILSHTQNGKIVVSKLDTKTDSVQKFDGTEPTVTMSLKTNGQKMFSNVGGINQGGLEASVQDLTENGVSGDIVDSYNGAENITDIEFVKSFRSRVNKVDSKPKDIKLDVRRKIGSLLKSAINLTINTDTIRFENGDVIRPNNVISVRNKELYLLNDTLFFIEKVSLKQGLVNDTATLSCVIPQVYNDDDLKDVF